MNRICSLSKLFWLRCIMTDTSFLFTFFTSPPAGTPRRLKHRGRQNPYRRGESSFAPAGGSFPLRQPHPPYGGEAYVAGGLDTIRPERLQEAVRPKETTRGSLHPAYAGNGTEIDRLALYHRFRRSERVVHL